MHGRGHAWLLLLLTARAPCRVVYYQATFFIRRLIGHEAVVNLLPLLPLLKSFNVLAMPNVTLQEECLTLTRCTAYPFHSHSIILFVSKQPFFSLLFAAYHLASLPDPLHIFK